MTHSAQAGARRVIPLVTAGLGIGIAVMAFAPAASSPPTGVAVGVHEANYELWGEAGSLHYYLRVHTAVRLNDYMEFQNVGRLLDGGDYAALETHILGEHGHVIFDARALEILRQISTDLDTSRDTLKMRLDTRYGCVPGYYFHAYMDYPLGGQDAVDLFFEVERMLRRGDYDAVQRVFLPPERIGMEPGTRAEAILQQVRPFEEATMDPGSE